MKAPLVIAQIDGACVAEHGRTLAEFRGLNPEMIESLILSAAVNARVNQVARFLGGFRPSNDR